MDPLTTQLGMALDQLLAIYQFPKLYNYATKGDIEHRCKIALRAYHDALREEWEKQDEKTADSE